MKPILIVYATREGQTQRIAEHLAGAVKGHDQSCEVVNAALIPKDIATSNYSTVVAAASLHGGKYEPEMVRFVKLHATELNSIPGVFVSVSLAESVVSLAESVEDTTVPAGRRAEADAMVRQSIDRFLAETGWHPSRIAAAAGALPYTKYGIVMRFVMKKICGGRRFAGGYLA